MSQRDILRRFERIEAVVAARRSSFAHLSDDEVEHRIDELLQKAGTSREAVIEQYGTLEAFVRVLKKELQDCRTALA